MSQIWVFHQPEDICEKQNTWKWESWEHMLPHRPKPSWNWIHEGLKPPWNHSTRTSLVWTCTKREGSEVEQRALLLTNEQQSKGKRVHNNEGTIASPLSDVAKDYAVIIVIVIVVVSLLPLGDTLSPLLSSVRTTLSDNVVVCHRHCRCRCWVTIAIVQLVLGIGVWPMWQTINLEWLYGIVTMHFGHTLTV